MQRYFRLLVIGLLAVFHVATAEAQPYVSHEILVKFVPDTTDARATEIRESLGAKLLSKIPSIGVEHWRLPGSLSVEDAVERLGRMPEVVYVEPNYLYKPQVTPSDPAFDRMWFLDNQGQSVNGTAGTPGADISAPAAWEIETGSSQVIVAVIDSGVAMDHPDIRNNIWINPGEIPGNGIDDDGNDYIDDINGWDFINEDNIPADYSRDMYGDGHGTHVSGIIAAEGDNGTGIAGVMWSARIMPLQVFDVFESSPLNGAAIQNINILRAVAYAVANGVKIINCSFGGPGYSAAQFDAFSRAGEQGCLVVAAAGNDAENSDYTPTYPAGYRIASIISVAATDENDNLAAYSNYGPGSVDLAAPGGNASVSNIYSLAPPVRVELFSDDFENGGDQWTTEETGGWFITDDETIFRSAAIRCSAGNYADNLESHIRTAATVSALARKGIHIRFDVEYQLEPPNSSTGKPGDFLLVEVSPDGVGFTPIYAITGFSTGIEQINLWSSDDDPEDFFLRFLLSTDASVNYKGVCIDNVRISGIEWDFAGNPYGYKSGTSMAAPVVSGVAGLIWSAAPDLEAVEVKSILLGSVDPLETLSGKVLTGGRANAARAVEMAINGTIPADFPADGTADLPDGGTMVKPSEDSDGGGCFVSAVGTFSI